MRLTVETGPLAGTTAPLDRERPAMLGSAEGATIRIQEAGVLDEHAVVKALKGEGFGIKAHGRVLLNGGEVQASRLRDGDVIEIGTTRIAYGEVQDRGMPKVAGYRLLDVLGKGGMGTVYRAEQTSLRRQVALKVLNKAQTRDAAFVSQFVAEARAAAKLQHPNVVSVFDVERDGDLYFYAMELMHDGSCEDWLKQNGTMPVDRALQVVADAAAGLAYAESLGIVHRDIKPDNLMLDQHGAVKIADLGLASTGADDGGAPAIGTPHFMAPEQVLKQELDHRTDLYALGCTFYRLVTGRTPFRGQTVKDILRAQVKEDAEPPSKANADVSPEVSAIIQRLMEKDPAARYQTANALLEDLEELLQPAQKRGLWIGLAAVAVLVAGGAIYWALTKPKETEVVIQREKFDDPLTQEFADRIELLEAEAKEKDATIALLQTRVAGAEGEALAAALDAVVGAHAGTAAAGEAQRLADEVRSGLAQQQQERELRLAKVMEHVASLRSSTVQPLDAHDYERAMRLLSAPAPEGLAGDPVLDDKVAQLRGEVLDKARARLQALTAPIAAAREAADEAGLLAALDALRQGLEPAARWPEQVAGDVTSGREVLAAGAQALAGLQEARLAGAWQGYRELLRRPQGLRDAIARLDFDAASAALAPLAADDAGGPAERAAAVRAWLASAQQFVGALERGCASGDLTLALPEGDAVVTAWDRTKQQFSLRTSDRRPKSMTLDYGAMLVDRWLELAGQVEDAPIGSRECFVALVALDAHARAAGAYLRRVDEGQDDSGTGDDGYPFSATVFDRLVTDLPRIGAGEGDAAPEATGAAPWAEIVRSELQAGKRLAAGLRALTERRNLAAAGHIEKLLSEHPNSLVVAQLP